MRLAMRKAPLFFLCVALALSGFLGLPAGAFGIEHFAEMPPEMDTEWITQEIVGGIGTASLPSGTLTSDDVDLSKAFKFYNVTEAGILDLSSSPRYNDVLQAIGPSTYMEVPIYKNGMSFLVILYIGPEVSEESKEKLRQSDPEYAEGMIRRLEEKAGRWSTHGYKQYEDDPHFDYYDDLARRSGITDRVPLLVNGIPYFEGPVALYANDEGLIDLMVPLYGGHNVDWSALGLSPDNSEGAMLDYETVKEKIAALPPEDEYYAQFSADAQDPDQPGPASPDPDQPGPASPDPDTISLGPGLPSPSPAHPLFAVAAGIVAAAALVVGIALLVRKILRWRAAIAGIAAEAATATHTAETDRAQK
jgi:hypothetical protein